MSPRQRAVLEFVRAHPRSSAMEVARNCHITDGENLTIMVRAGHLVRVKEKRPRRSGRTGTSMRDVWVYSVPNAPPLTPTEPEAHILRCLENLPADKDRRRALLGPVTAALLGET